VVVTEAGRRLRADGGIFPDLMIADDTLTTPEQNLLIASARVGVPLTLRIAEFAFERARQAMEGSAPPELEAGAVEAFIQSLREEGVPSEVLDHPDVPRYLTWRARIAFEDRVGHMGHALEHQAERDRVLQKAIQILERSHTQAELLAAVEAEAAARANRAEASAAQLPGV
jgi:hypothetical protein